MLVISLLETELGKNAPLSDRENLVFVDHLIVQKMKPDTTQLVDSSLVAGIMKYDTTYTYEEKEVNTHVSSSNLWFLKEHFTKLPSASNYTFCTTGASTNIFVNDKKLNLDLVYADHRYWEIFDFTFLEGRPFDENILKSEESAVVISQKMAMKYFGQKNNVVGKEIKFPDANYKVIGLVKDPSQIIVYADVYLPNTKKIGFPGKPNKYFGSYWGIFKADSKNKVKNIKSEIHSIANNMTFYDPAELNKMTIHPKTDKELYAHLVVSGKTPEQSKKLFFGILFSLLALFALLPTLNLVNLNVTRIMERASEIGVRKAFGANRSHIVYQFIFENIVLTILGGMIGFIIALILIKLINDGQVQDLITLKVNFNFFIYSILLILFFGILSGFLPALKMSKLHIVNALKK